MVAPGHAYVDSGGPLTPGELRLEADSTAGKAPGHSDPEGFLYFLQTVLWARSLGSPTGFNQVFPSPCGSDREC